MAFVLTTIDCPPWPVPQKRAGEPVSCPTPRVLVGTGGKSGEEFAAECELLHYLSYSRTLLWVFSLIQCSRFLLTPVGSDGASASRALPEKRQSM